MTEKFARALSYIKFDIDGMRDTNDYDWFYDLFWFTDLEMSIVHCFAEHDDEFQAIRDLEHERIKVYSERHDDLREEFLRLSREHEQELENENAKLSEEIDDLNLKIEKLEDDNYARAEVIANARLDGAIQ